MMTDTTLDRSDGYVPTGHPVRSFVLVLTAIGFIFGAIWWTGLIAPRLGEDGEHNGSFDAATEATGVRARYRNEGHMTVRIERISLTSQTLPDVTVESRVLDQRTAASDAGGNQPSLPADQGFDLPPGRDVEVIIGYRAGQCADHDARLELLVRGPLGFHRTISKPLQLSAC